jgi:hypothetical protein
MFDLKILDGMVHPEDDTQGYLLLACDHFTKYKWGRIIWGKDVMAISMFLYETFGREGTPERWHCDNGREFLNGCVEMARKHLGLGNLFGLLPYTHGGVRYYLHEHPPIHTLAHMFIAVHIVHQELL